MSKKFFTNQDGNTLEKKFKGIFEFFKPHFFDILVGYFRASGYFMIKDFIHEVHQVRILVGINTDTLIMRILG